MQIRVQKTKYNTHLQLPPKWSSRAFTVRSSINLKADGESSSLLYLNSSSLTVFTLPFSCRYFSVAGYDMKTFSSPPNFFCRCFLKGISAFRRSCVFFKKSAAIQIRFPQKGVISRSICSVREDLELVSVSQKSHVDWSRLLIVAA